MVPAVVLALATAAAQGTPAAPDRFVTDLAGRVSASAEQALDSRLETFEDLTGHQVLLWIGPSGGEDPESFAVRAFDAWRPGRAGVDDGLVLFLFPEERRSRIEVGYGLEGVVPDAVASRVLRDVVAPRLQAGDWDEGTAAGMDALLVAIDAAAAARSGATAPAARPVFEPTGDAIVFGIAALAFLVLLVVNPRLAMALLWGLAASSRGNRSWSSRSGFGSSGSGWSGGGGGGFSGGGGRSGGGGASGSW